MFTSNCHKPESKQCQLTVYTCASSRSTGEEEDPSLRFCFSEPTLRVMCSRSSRGEAMKTTKGIRPEWRTIFNAWGRRRRSGGTREEEGYGTEKTLQ